jgi:hypothetical protein
MLLVSACIGTFGGIGLLLRPQPAIAQAEPSPASVDPANEAGRLRAEIERLKTLVPDQAHAMEDVGRHFSNLWFAGQAGNWSLAQFYLNETRSHLRWAVRIIPVRKTKAGDIELQGILDAFESSKLDRLQKAIESRDKPAFSESYRQAMSGCYSCHIVSEKPFLCPRMPADPPERIINMDPNARWPE